MSSGYQTGGYGEQPSHELQRAAETRDKTEHQSLLEQVLQTTLALGRGGNDPLSPEELRTLTSIAHRRKAEPLSVETTMELVQAVLRLRYRSLAESRDQWERMTRQIAETIFDDPQTKERLESLWALLCEAER
jgi:hypothetical protein